MAWNSADTYRAGLDFFTRVVRAVPGDRWDSPSPCAGWAAKDVLGHVGEATEMGARILRGGDMAFRRHEPPSSSIVGDPVAWWTGLADNAADALDTVRDLDAIVDSPMGARPIREGLSFPAVDLFIHGWDLASATGQAVTIPDEAIAFTLGLFEKVPDEVARTATVFSPAREAPSGATPTEALIAFTGRDPRWVQHP